MIGIRKKTKAGFILLSTVVVAFLYYQTPLRLSVSQELFTRFYYIPIILGGRWFGFRGGVQASLLVTMICVPHTINAYKCDQDLFYDELLELLFFNFIGPVFGAFRDRERRQSAINQRLKSLAAIGETVSSIAHEMKNILMPMRGFLRRLREKRCFDAKEANYLEIVEQEASNLDRMVKEMLAFGRHAPLQREEVEVRSLVDDMRQKLDDAFHHNGIRLVCQCPEGKKRVRLDREKVRSALMNLLQNALDASPKGKEVRLLVQANEHFLRIIIEDEGTGIPKKHLDRIFHPFFTTKPQGTGLGLAITQKIVRDHGGEIRVKSTPGDGTSFILSFPILDQVESEGTDPAY